MLLHRNVSGTRTHGWVVVQTETSQVRARTHLCERCTAFATTVEARGELCWPTSYPNPARIAFRSEAIDWQPFATSCGSSNRVVERRRIGRLSCAGRGIGILSASDSDRHNGDLRIRCPEVWTSVCECMVESECYARVIASNRAFRRGVVPTADGVAPQSYCGRGIVRPQWLARKVFRINRSV